MKSISILSEKRFKGIRNVINVPPLYNGIPTKVIKMDETQIE